MSDRVKEIVLKALIVFGMLCLFTLFPGGILLAFLVPNPNTLSVILYTALFAMIATGVLFVILQLIFGGINPRTEKPEKIALKVGAYDEFSSNLETTLLNAGYSKTGVYPVMQDGSVMLYSKLGGADTLDCFSIIRIAELTEEAIEAANVALTDVFTRDSNGKRITKTVNMISVFCVDRITQSFNGMINGNVEQGLKNGRLPVGISFGGKNVYIGKQRDGFAILKYRRLRKEFLALMESSGTI